MSVESGPSPEEMGLHDEGEQGGDEQQKSNTSSRRNVLKRAAALGVTGAGAV